VYLGPVIVRGPGRPVKGAARVANVTGDHLGRQAGSQSELAGFHREFTASPVLAAPEVGQGVAPEVRLDTAPKVRLVSAPKVRLVSAPELPCVGWLCRSPASP
jgi:hypothetical protein